jgi:PAS domain-containing protein
LIKLKDDKKLLDYVVDQLVEPAAFIKKVQDLYASSVIDSDTIFFKDGRIFDRYSKPLLLQQEIVGRVWSFRDVTAIRRRENELIEKTTFLEAMVNASPEGILVVDASGKRLFQNQQNIDLWSIPHEMAGNANVVEQRAWVQNLTVDPSSFSRRIQYLQEHPLENFQDEVELKNGKVLERLTSPVVSKQGVYYGRIWTIRDIT